MRAEDLVPSHASVRRRWLASLMFGLIAIYGLYRIVRLGSRVEEGWLIALAILILTVSSSLGWCWARQQLSESPRGRMIRGNVSPTVAHIVVSFALLGVGVVLGSLIGEALDLAPGEGAADFVAITFCAYSATRALGKARA